MMSDEDLTAWEDWCDSQYREREARAEEAWEYYYADSFIPDRIDTEE